jgi:dTDP-4-dehydrorhamnose reductase
MRMLVLGADSSVGSSLLSLAESVGVDCCGTTRKRFTEKSRIHLDLLDRETWKESFLWKPSVVVGCFAVSNLKECEENPSSRLINVDSICELLDCFGDAGAQIVLLSTNSVFGGERALCVEDDPVSPQLAYSCQKAEAEARFLCAAARRGNSKRAAIVRLTRVLTPSVAPFSSWSKALSDGKTIEAFRDFIFSPVSCGYVARSLLRVAESQEGGIFHLSGAEDLSYFEFAELLAQYFRRGNVQATDSAGSGVSLLFKPTHSALGMQRTQRLLGIAPQTPSSVISELAQEWLLAA